MINFFKKPGRWAGVYSALLIAAVAFTLLDTFAIPKAYAQVAQAGQGTAQAAQEAESAAAPESESEENTGATDVQAEISATAYVDENISIIVETVVSDGTTFYVANIQINDASLLKTALAQGVYGRNIKQLTSEMAEENGAIFAINGDYYGFRDTGYVLRNGVLYRSTPGDGQALVIDTAGNFTIVQESQTSAEELLEAGAWQVLSFGPALVENGQIVVDEDDEVSRAKSSNPRTAIGQVGPLHYIVIVSDGRTDESEGLSLYQLAAELAQRGAVTAYNLDGGGSSTMVLNGQVLNTTTNGRSNSEREVSDIVYFGY